MQSGGSLNKHSGDNSEYGSDQDRNSNNNTCTKTSSAIKDSSVRTLPLLSMSDNDLYERLLLVKMRIYNEARENQEYKQELLLVEKVVTSQFIYALIQNRPTQLSKLFEKNKIKDENEQRKFIDKYGKYLIDEINHQAKMQSMINALVESYVNDRNEEMDDQDQQQGMESAQKESGNLKADNDDNDDMNIEDDELAKFLEDDNDILLSE